MMILFPLSFGVAVLRYRLYEIDGSCPDGVVCAGRRIVGRSVPGHRRADVLSAADRVIGPCVAGSTLVVAALFNPLRRRVQGGVDRRFNRQRYDAQRVMDGFASSLRDRADPEEVMTGWVGVVSSTMQPDAIGMWMRDDDGADADLALERRRGRRSSRTCRGHPPQVGWPRSRERGLRRFDMAPSLRAGRPSSTPNPPPAMSPLMCWVARTARRSCAARGSGP